MGPDVLWSKVLPNGGFIGEGLRKGTGVVLSTNEETLWATSENGGLFVLGATDGNILASFEPETIAGHNTESRSSVFLHQNSESVEFGVYAVVDVPEHHGDALMATSDITRRYVCLFSRRLAVVSPICNLIRSAFCLRFSLPSQPNHCTSWRRDRRRIRKLTMV
jgi:hypothetical protein